MLLKLLFSVIMLINHCKSFFVVKQTKFPNRLKRGPLTLTMGSNAKFGIFSPAVYTAKLILGEPKLNKVKNHNY